MNEGRQWGGERKQKDYAEHAESAEGGEGNDKGQNPNDKGVTNDWNDKRARIGSEGRVGQNGTFDGLQKNLVSRYGSKKRGTMRVL